MRCIVRSLSFRCRQDFLQLFALGTVLCLICRRVFRLARLIFCVPTVIVSLWRCFRGFTRLCDWLAALYRKAYRTLASGSDRGKFSLRILGIESCRISFIGGRTLFHGCLPLRLHTASAGNDSACLGRFPQIDSIGAPRFFHGVQTQTRLPRLRYARRIVRCESSPGRWFLKAAVAGGLRVIKDMRICARKLSAAVDHRLGTNSKLPGPGMAGVLSCLPAFRARQLNHLDILGEGERFG